jgi:hypothetical protein
MKRKALAIVLTLLMLVSVLPMGAFAASETDTTVPAEAEAQTQSYTDTKGHWAEKSIERWTAAKVLEGMGDNLFAPDDNLTRAQAMTIFSRLLNLTEKGDISKLEDVAADAWYAPYIETGYAYQIIKGTSDTTFDPEGSITREQFFSIFARATGIPGTDKLDEGKTFTDLDQISSWFIDEGTVYSMINRGYLNGYPDGSLQPKGNITRAEVAKVLDNAISDYITEDGTYDISGDGIVVVLAKNVKLTGNFNGHIVSSCADSTLDLSGLTGTPYIYVLGDNTKIIGAKTGTKVAVNPAADNVTVNAVKVAYDPYAPVSPYIVPAGGSGGGGGGAGGGGQRSNATAIMAFKPLGNLAGSYALDIRYDVKTSDTAQKVFNGLAKDAKTIGGAVDGILADIANKTWEDGDDSVEVKNGEISVIVNGVQKDLPAKLDVASGNFKDAAAKVADKLTTPAAQNAWDKVVELLDPTNLFDKGTNDTLAIKYKSGDDYAQILSDVLTQLGIIAQNESDLDTIMEAVYGGSTATYNANAWKDDIDAPCQIVEITGVSTDAADASNMINMVVPFNTDSELVDVMLKAGVEGPSQLLSGDYQFTFEIVKK